MSAPIVALAALALTLAAAQSVKVWYLSRCHFGVLAPAALRWQLLLWQWRRKPCAVIALDVRKMHDGNEVFGYSTMNELVGSLVRIRLRPGRNQDIIGQYGGDEFGVVVDDPDAGEAVVERLIAQMRAITEAMPAHQRQALYERTGGLVNGLDAAIVLIPHSTRALDDLRRAVDRTGTLKAGAVTGSRSTSGKAGTLVEVLG